MGLACTHFFFPTNCLMSWRLCDGHFNTLTLFSLNYFATKFGSMLGVTAHMGDLIRDQRFDFLAEVLKHFQIFHYIHVIFLFLDAIQPRNTSTFGPLRTHLTVNIFESISFSIFTRTHLTFNMFKPNFSSIFTRFFAVVLGLIECIVFPQEFDGCEILQCLFFCIVVCADEQCTFRPLRNCFQSMS